MLRFCIPMQATFPLACSILKVVAHAILKVMVAFQDMDHPSGRDMPKLTRPSRLPGVDQHNSERAYCPRTAHRKQQRSCFRSQPLLDRLSAQPRANRCSKKAAETNAPVGCWWGLPACDNKPLGPNTISSSRLAKSAGP